MTDLVARAAVRLLMPTEPAPRMTSPDAQRLRGLAEEVRRDLGDRGIVGRARLARELTERVERVTEQPTDRAVAIYVGPAGSRTFWLSFPVVARRAVERTPGARPVATALDRLQAVHTADPGAVVSGTAACWHAVHRGAPDLLLVEEELLRPDSPRALVDDLVEVVTLRGGQVVRVDSGDLAAYGRVALLTDVRTDGRTPAAAARTSPSGSGPAGRS